MKQYLFTFLVRFFLLFEQEHYVLYNTGDQIWFIYVFGLQTVTRIITWDNIRWTIGDKHITMPKR